MSQTEHILMLSYGKDSLACLGAIKELGWPLDRIIHAEVWATDDIPADLPPMVEFKPHADAWIKENFGIEVEHISATKNGEKLTFEKMFYHKPKRRNPDRYAAWVDAKKKGGQVLQWTSSGIPSLTIAMVQQQSQSTTSTDGHSQSEDGARNSSIERILGFPMLRGMWCNSDLKMRVF